MWFRLVRAPTGNSIYTLRHPAEKDHRMRTIIRSWIDSGDVGQSMFRIQEQVARGLEDR